MGVYVRNLGSCFSQTVRPTSFANLVRPDDRSIGRTDWNRHSGALVRDRAASSPPVAALCGINELLSY